MSRRIRVDPAVVRRYPDFRLRVVYALGVENGPSDERSRGLLHEAASIARARVAQTGIAEHPAIAVWRAAYRSFGSKPSSYRCSVEALVQRAVKEGPHALPSVNRLVDVYNAVSLRYLLPVGGEDLDQLRGDLVLRFAAGSESFDGPDQAGVVPSFTEAGEVIWADDAGATCRRWNWRQGRRTRLRETTVNAYFIVEALESAVSEAELDLAVEDLCTGLRSYAAALEIHVCRDLDGTLDAGHSTEGQGHSTERR